MFTKQLASSEKRVLMKTCTHCGRYIVRGKKNSEQNKNRLHGLLSEGDKTFKHLTHRLELKESLMDTHYNKVTEMCDVLFIAHPGGKWNVARETNALFRTSGT